MDSSDPTAVARLVTDAATAQRLVEALAEALDAGAGAATVAAHGGASNTGGAGDAGSWTVEIYFTHAPDEDATRALIGRLADAGAAARLAFARIARADWVAASLEGLAPVAAGRFLIHGSHHRGRVASNRIGIEIEAALAFGTGHHGTTRGCLLALDRLLKTRLVRSVLDVGTGTGVLAIAAARGAPGARGAGARRHRVLASDIDPVSVRVARDNARLNHVAMQIIRADALGDRRFRAAAPFDLVFANILLGELKRLAKPIRTCARPGTRVVLSGLLPSQANAALAAYRSQGFALERRILLDGWATLVLAIPVGRRLSGSETHRLSRDQ
jgi:ribosomal protein L11 methyltransferase